MEITQRNILEELMVNKSQKPRGLKYIDGFITEKQEKDLLSIINKQPWDNTLKRKVQHYGYKYNYSSKLKVPCDYLGALPEWLQTLANDLKTQGIFTEIPDQVIINKYEPGEGITEHIDNIHCFSNTICSLSMGSNCIMRFKNGERVFEQNLKRRSVLILSSEARYKWKHEIPFRKKDGNYERHTRISLTFRKVVQCL